MEYKTKRKMSASQHWIWILVETQQQTQKHKKVDHKQSIFKLLGLWINDLKIWPLKPPPPFFFLVETYQCSLLFRKFRPLFTPWICLLACGKMLNKVLKFGVWEPKSWSVVWIKWPKCLPIHLAKLITNNYTIDTCKKLRTWENPLCSVTVKKLLTFFFSFKAREM